MRLNNHQKKMVCEATAITRRIFEAGGSLKDVTQEEAALLLDVMGIIEEHEQPDESKELLDIIDRHVEPDEEDR